MLAPPHGGNINGNKYEGLQHAGHILNDCALILAPLMDNGFTAVIDTGSVGW
jgi:hypothetical protein